MQATDGPAFGTAANGAASAADPIRDALTGRELENAWNGCLDAWEGATAEQAVSARVFAAGLRDQLLEALRPVDDPADREAVALLGYLRLRAYWFQINAAVGYARDDAAQTGDVYRAALTSTLIEALEPHLPAGEVRRIEEFTARMMAGAAVDDAGELARAASALLPAQDEFRRRVQNLLATIESLSERVVRQEGELIVLRAGQDALHEAFGGEFVNAGEMARRVRVLQAQVEVLEAQARVDEVHDQVLQQSLGTTDKVAVASVVRDLRQRLDESERRVAVLEDERRRAAEAAGEGVAPEQVPDHVRDLGNALRLLAAEKIEQEQAAAALRAERDALLAATGCASGDELAARFRDLAADAAAFREMAGLLGDMDRTLNAV
jgi:hypothetical protein